MKNDANGRSQNNINLQQNRSVKMSNTNLKSRKFYNAVRDGVNFLDYNKRQCGCIIHPTVIEGKG